MKNIPLRGIILFSCFLVLTCATFAFSAEQFTARLPYPEAIQELYLENVKILNRHGDSLVIEISDDALAGLIARGWHIEPLPSTQKSVYYSSYDELLDRAKDIVRRYPQISDLNEIGMSAAFRPLTVLKISDNAHADQPKPALFFELSIHGNESACTQVGLCMAEALVQNYGADQEIRDLVDAFEFHFLISANPDGLELGTRNNANNIDLNRNFGFWWEEDGGPDSQPETRAITDFVLEQGFMQSLSFHTGSALVNYPFDSTPTRAPDDALFQIMAEAYGDAAGYPVTNGYDWYRATGIAEETYYGAAGTLAMLVEISNSFAPEPDELIDLCKANLDGLLAWAQLAYGGFHGRVTDANTGQPISAHLESFPGGWPFFSSQQFGDFHRFAEDGTYTLTISANGYRTESFEVTLPLDAELNLSLNPVTEGRRVFSANRIPVVNTPRPAFSFDNETMPFLAISESDGRAFSLGPGGSLLLDMGRFTPVSSLPGADFRIFEDDSDGTQSYRVSVADNRRGPFTTIATASGTRSFELPAGRESARYLLIEDISTSDDSGPTPGADIDAVEHYPRCPLPIGDFNVDNTEGQAPFQANFQVTSETPEECLDGFFWYFGDSQTSQGENVTHVYEEPGLFPVTLILFGAGGAAAVLKEELIFVEGDVQFDDDDYVDDDDDDGRAFGLAFDMDSDDDEKEQPCGC